MPAPYIVASYATSYSTTGTSKNVTVSCQLNDTLVVIALGGKNTTFTAPTASGVSFANTVGSNGDATYPAARGYVALLVSSQSNTTVTMGESSGTVPWGFTCFVVRNVRATADPTEFFAQNTTTAYGSYTNSLPRPLVLVAAVDANANDGTSRTWQPAGGISPSQANGQELTYQFISGNFTAYSAYYLIGGSGAKSLGVSPGGANMTVRHFQCALYGDDAAVETAIGLRPATTGTSITTGGLDFTSIVNYVLCAAYVGVRPVNGTDTSVTTTATCNGFAMTSLAKIHSNSGTQGYVEVFGFNAKTTGIQNISVTANTTVDLQLSYAGFTNVDLANPIKAIQTATGSSSTASITHTGLELRHTIFSATIAGNTIGTASAGSTAWVRRSGQNLFNTSSDGGAAAYSVFGAPTSSSTISHTVTSAPWAMISIALNTSSVMPDQAVYGFRA